MSDTNPTGFPSLKFLSFGAGAIGTYVGGSLVLAGHDLVFLEKPKVVGELQKRGLRLDLRADRTRSRAGPSFVRPIAFHVTDSIEESLGRGPFDAALFALKSFDTDDLLESLAPFRSQLPPFLCLSNGVENEQAIASAFGADKVMYASITTAITRRSAGDIVLEKLRGIGIAAGHPLSENLVSIFDDAHLNCRLYRGGPGMKWSKMLTNLVSNPTSAILDWTPAQVLAHNGLYQLEIDMLRECLEVMRAQGFHVMDLPGTPVRALALATRLPFWLSKPLLMGAAGSGRGGKMPSLHIDLHSGRGESEVVYLHGAVARAGEKLGIPTPVNKMLTRILVGLTSGEIAKDEFTDQPEKLLAQL